MSKPLADPPGVLSFTTTRADGVVVVTAEWPRACRRQVTDTIETITTTFRFDKKRTTRTGPPEALVSQCPIPARRTPIHLKFPSGLELDAQTDDRGELVFLLPTGEERGEVLASGDANAPLDVPPDQVSLDPAPPPMAKVGTPSAERSAEALQMFREENDPPTGFKGVRDALQRCGAHHRVDGMVGVTLVIDPSGRITRFALDRGGPELASCVRAEVAAVRFEASHGGRTITVPFKIVAPHR